MQSHSIYSLSWGLSCISIFFFKIHLSRCMYHFILVWNAPPLIMLWVHHSIYAPAHACLGDFWDWLLELLRALVCQTLCTLGHRSSSRMAESYGRSMLNFLFLIRYSYCAYTLTLDSLHVLNESCLIQHYLLVLTHSEGKMFLYPV